MDSSSPPSGDMLTCSRPLMERRLRPQHDQALKCPRCDSTHTKFCYYNNYSLSQPRYFCKTCRRYWTKGGTLRNIPVGGGCRKNKKVSATSSKKANDHHHQSINQISTPGSSSSHHNHNPTDLHLSFPDVQFSQHLTTILGAHHGIGNPGDDDHHHHHLMQLENPRPIDFMESKYDFIGGMVGGGIGDHMGSNRGLGIGNFNGVCSSPFGLAIDGNDNGSFIDSCQRLMLPYDALNEEQNTIDVKPNPKSLLSLQWQDQEVGKDNTTFGYLNNLGSWTGMINGYGSSTTTNQLV